MDQLNLNPASTFLNRQHGQPKFNKTTYLVSNTKRSMSMWYNELQTKAVRRNIRDSNTQNRSMSLYRMFFYFSSTISRYSGTSFNSVAIDCKTRQQSEHRINVEISLQNF